MHRLLVEVGAGRRIRPYWTNQYYAAQLWIKQVRIRERRDSLQPSAQFDNQAHFAQSVPRSASRIAGHRQIEWLGSEAGCSSTSVFGPQVHTPMGSCLQRKA
jgi:hypothetical protein